MQPAGSRRRPAPQAAGDLAKLLLTSKERILAAINGQPADRVPLTTWCFGFPAPKHLEWQTGGHPVPYWYSKRLEHIHTLPHPWELEDEFKRAAAWLSLGIDDVLEVSVPWSRDPAVVVKDSVIPPGGAGGRAKYPVMARNYETPSGRLHHAAWRTAEEPTPGWPMQPGCVMLLEDYNVARATHHPVSQPGDVPAIKHLFMPPDAQQRRWFAERMAKIKAFADEKWLVTQASTGFGMDAAVWFTGTEGAVMMAMDVPDFRAVDRRHRRDRLARIELAAATAEWIWSVARLVLVNRFLVARPFDRTSTRIWPNWRPSPIGTARSSAT